MQIEEAEWNKTLMIRTRMEKAKVPKRNSISNPTEMRAKMQVATKQVSAT